MSTYERFIHPQMLKHRCSRSSSSSRAIPLKRMLEWTQGDIAVPLHWGNQRSGMQSGRSISKGFERLARFSFECQFQNTIHFVKHLHDDLGLHKEIVNRHLEPFGWITEVFTMGRDQLMNFLTLRVSPHAQSNIQRLAVNMARQYRDSTPRELDWGQWHLPFHNYDFGIPVGEPEDLGEILDWDVARSAWVSYNAPGKETTWENARKRHLSCVQDKHMTPCEHQLRAEKITRGLVPGYASYRMMLPNESASDFDFSILDKYDAAGVDYLIP